MLLFLLFTNPEQCRQLLTGSTSGGDDNIIYNSSCLLRSLCRQIGFANKHGKSMSIFSSVCLHALPSMPSPPDVLILK